MGYRSEIGILVTIPKKSSAKSMFNKLFSKWDKNDLDNVFETKSFVEYGQKYLYVHTKYDIKWYAETFEDEKATMHFIYNFNYKTGGINFLRIGEDYEDVEMISVGEPEKYIQLDRSMYL